MCWPPAVFAYAYAYAHAYNHTQEFFNSDGVRLVLEQTLSSYVTGGKSDVTIEATRTAYREHLLLVAGELLATGPRPPLIPRSSLESPPHPHATVVALAWPSPRAFGQLAAPLAC